MQLNDRVASHRTSMDTQQRVAFPQPTALSYPYLLWGTTASASVLGLVVSISIWPTLWLMGASIGALLGYDTSSSSSRQATLTEFESNALRNLLLACGRRLATLYLKIVDASQAFFFMYKTGQLSYEYYKRYAVLDRKFAIQSKVDAWNARFVQGKLAFDRWERDNEVGRKLLAGLRTAWLVEERNVRKRRNGLKQRQSRYRLVQLWYDAMFALRSLWKSTIKAFVGDNVRDFGRGLYQRTIGSIGHGGNAMHGLSDRLTSTVTALVALICTGTFVTRSPILAAILVAILAWQWPDWRTEMTDRIQTVVDETRALGQGQTDTTSNGKPQLKFGRTAAQTKKNDTTNRYHFYTTLNGTRRYYRVGQPWWSFWLDNSGSGSSNPFSQRKSTPKASNLLWPWSK